MKHKKNLFLCLIAILAIFSVVSCAGDLPDIDSDGDTSGEITLDKSEDLEAWRRACSNYTPSAQESINIQVTGTVTSITPKNLYIQDAKDGAMFIYGDTKNLKDPEGNAVAVGKKVTLQANNITTYQKGYQVNNKDNKSVTILKVEDGQAVSPKLITTKAEFDSLGTENKLDFVKLYCRITAASGEYTTRANILTEEEYNTIKSDADAMSKLPENKTELQIELHTQYSDKYNIGDLCIVTGQMTNFGNTRRLTAINTVERVESTFQIETKDHTIADWQAVSNENPSSVFTEYMRIKGYVVNTKYNDAYTGSDGKYHKPYYDLVIADETGNCMVLHESTTEEEYQKVKNDNYKVGAEITFVAKNSDTYKGSSQCTDFVIESKPVTATKTIADMCAWSTLDITKESDFNDSKVTEKKQKLGYLANQKIVHIPSTKIDKVNKNRNGDKVSSFSTSLPDTTFAKVKYVTYTEKPADWKADTNIEVYARIGIEEDNGKVTYNFYVISVERIENTTV